MTKPTYSELEAENLGVRGLLQRQWISVEERLPEDEDSSVWVCFENGSHYCSARYIDEEWFGYDLQIEDTFHIEQKITHWMPLQKLTNATPLTVWMNTTVLTAAHRCPNSANLRLSD